MIVLIGFRSLIVFRLATPIEIPSHRTSIFDDVPEPSRRLSRPVSALSTNESNTYDYTKSLPTRRNIDQDSRLTNISPIDVPSSYDLFESGLPKSNSNSNMLRTGLTRPSSATTAPAAPNVSRSGGRLSRFYHSIRLERDDFGKNSSRTTFARSTDRRAEQTT